MNEDRIKELAKNYTINELLEGIEYKFNEIYTWIPDKYKKFDPKENENPFFSEKGIHTNLKFNVKPLNKSDLIKMPLIDKSPKEDEKQIAKDNVISNLSKYYLEKIHYLEKEIECLKHDRDFNNE